MMQLGFSQFQKSGESTKRSSLLRNALFNTLYANFRLLRHFLSRRLRADDRPSQHAD